MFALLIVGPPGSDYPLRNRVGAWIIVAATMLLGVGYVRALTYRR